MAQPIVYMEKAHEPSSGSAKLLFPAATRNGGAILEKLRELLPVQDNGGGTPVDVLEVGSGSGQHVAMFALHLPHTRWQPSDVASVAFDSIQEHINEAGVNGRVHNPVLLDANSSFTAQLSGRTFSAVVAINIFHIVPWTTCIGVLKGAASVLVPGGSLFVYGPFARDGVLQPQSNVDFDRDLKQRNAEWGVRDMLELGQEASKVGLQEMHVHTMPSNNHILQFVRQPRLSSK